MTDARSKIRAAFASILDQNLEQRLDQIVIAVTADGQGRSDLLLASFLGDIMGRLWRRILISGAQSDQFAAAARAGAASGGQSDPIISSHDTPDFEIAIGCRRAYPNVRGFTCAGSGFSLRIGDMSRGSDDQNPAGPFSCACVAAAEVFKVFFAPDLVEDKFIRESFQLDARSFGGIAPYEEFTELRLEDVHVFGVGAVTHAALTVLERWPHKVTGSLVLVDRDNYDCGNGERYIGMRPSDIGQSKARQWAERLRQRHPRLHVNAVPLDMNEYYAQHRPECDIRVVVAGLDKVESRRQLALKLPQVAINMWTGGDTAGASLHVFDGIGACLYCAYPDDRTQPDEVGILYGQTGLPPERIRFLRDSSTPLDANDARVIASRYGLEAQTITGRPLNSVIGDICSVVSTSLPGSSDVVDVPFAPVSGYAGAGGFMALARAATASKLQATEWQTRIFAYPTAYSCQIARARADCYLCSDPLAQCVRSAKYASG